MVRRVTTPGADASTSAEPVLAGQLGDFEVVGVLGTGGSGVVLDARWGHREVALKVLHPNLIPTERERTQFLEEARRLQDISHPGVVKVLASGELPDGRPYLAMEKLAGPTLAARLAEGPIPLAQALALFEQLAGAVQALHDRGLIHRDLKPENVVLVGEAHAVLLDFGIAKALAAPASTTTQDGGVRGTPAYMAPERFFGQPASVATDVYELGVTLYAMLAGTLPWADCGDPEVRLNPASLGAAAPEAVDVEIRRALSTRAQNRPASARELAAAVLAAAGLPAATTGSRTTTQVPLDLSSRGPAWFEQRTGTGENKGQTPLAWAPTARQQPLAEVAPRRRVWWPIAAGVVAAAAAVVGWIVLRGDDSGRDGSSATRAGAMTSVGSAEHDGSSGSARAGSGSASDPWATAVNEATPPTPPRPIADLRAEMVAGVGKLPAGTRTVLALGVAEARQDPDLGRILETVAARPEVKLMIGSDEDCKLTLADIDWVVMGFDQPGFHREAEIVIRGRWTRTQLEDCLAALAGGTPELDQATLVTHIDGKRNHFWLGMDGDVAVISTRDKITATEIAALVARDAGPAGVAGALVRELDPDASMWLIVDQDDDDRIDQMPGIPAGLDIGAWARAEGGLHGRVLARFRSGADAKKAETYFRAKIAEAMEQGGDMLGKFEVARAKRDVALTAWITPLTMGLAATQLTAP